jgi:7,8-dihydropterin-6-yl-methyl-4-(beta-D-ribofuranosyl)aminobenzene 5'-phosphate synthase
MKVKVLVDNTARDGFEAVHGFSILIEDKETVLFDFGPNSLYKENAEKMGVDLSLVKTLVLSHGHWDHGDGLLHLNNKRLILHPDCFIQRFRKRNTTHVGLSMKRDELMERYELIETKEPFLIADNIYFLGEVPRLNDFESKLSPFLLENGEPDFVMDDSALAVKTSKGLVIISGCAHSGICNTVSYAKKVCGEDRIYAVLGGFHLKEIDEITRKTIEYLKGENVYLLGPTHCTSFKVRDEFEKHFNLLELNAGAEIQL